MDRQNAVEAALISIKIVYIHNPPSAFLGLNASLIVMQKANCVYSQSAFCITIRLAFRPRKAY